MPEAAPQHEGILVVRLRDPLVLALAASPGRPWRRSCCWSSRRGTPAARAPRAPVRPTGARARRLRPARLPASTLRPSTARSVARIDSHSHSSNAKVVRPPSRWPVTMSGFSSQVTVSMPSMPWNTTSASSTSANHTLTPRSRRARIDSAAMHDDDAGRACSPRSDGSSPPRPCARRRPWRSAPRDAGGRDVPETSRPVRATQAGIGQARVAAEHDHAETENGADEGQAPDPGHFTHVVAASTDVRQLEQLLEIAQQVLAGVAGVVPHHEIAERIDDEQVRSRSPGNCASNCCASGEDASSAIEPGLLAPRNTAGRSNCRWRGTRAARASSRC